MALTEDRLLEIEFPGKGDRKVIKSNVEDVYYKGALINVVGGYGVVAADTASHSFYGICEKQVVVGSGETKDIPVIRNTCVWLDHSGAAQTDVGKLFYAVGDDAIDDTAVNTEPMGKCVDWDTGKLFIDLSDRVV